MGRRSEHTRTELAELIVEEGHRQMAELGFNRFSARSVARAIGYSVGTIYNVFASLDHLLVAINSRTFEQWNEHLRVCMRDCAGHRICALVEGYFSVARANPNLWMAIYDHRLPPEMVMAEDDAERRAALVRTVAEEVGQAVRVSSPEEVQRLARSLIATVHGHCSFDLNGSFAVMGETDPVGMALDRVRQALAAAGR
jgi:AcrR family transcriptional regulator